MIKTKNSQAHVEIIISFAIFLGALAFVFIFINPFAKGNASTNNFDSFEKILIEKLSVDVGKLSLVSYDTINGCYKISDFSKYSDKNYMEIIENSPTYKKYSIYFSDFILSSSAPHNSMTCDESSYNLGVYSNEKIISYEELKNVKKDCSTGCDDFKKNNGINFDFSFNCKDLDNNYIDEISFSRKIPVGVEAGAKEFPIRAITNEGKIIELVFNLRVW